MVLQKDQVQKKEFFLYFKLFVPIQTFCNTRSATEAPWR